MAERTEIRRDPEALLRSLKRAEEKEGKGRLKIFFGMCAGVGKTYEMLQAAHEARKKGVDVVIGYVETHSRRETEALVAGLTIIPRKNVEYRGTVIDEMDIDAILARKPALVLVDELAHTNAPGSRHARRYLDVLELLENGVEVYTTLNVQHLESRADTVAQITGTIVRETIPDSVFERADEVEVIDLPPDELLKRLAEGKVYTVERSQRALQNFFRRGNLTALREMALRLGAERVDRQLRDYMQTESIRGAWKSGHRFIVGITPGEESVRLIRWTKRLAFPMQASWAAVFVESGPPLTEPEKKQLAKNITLARELGAETLTTADADVPAALVRVAREQNATQIIVGKSGPRPFWKRSLADRLVALSQDLDIYVTSGESSAEEIAKPGFRLPQSQSGLSQYVSAATLVFLASAVCFPFTEAIGYQTVSFILLLIVMLLPLRLGVGPVILAAALSALTWDYFFIPPRFTLVVAQPQDILMMISLFTIATVTGVLTVRIRARERAVRTREERAIALYSLTNDLSAAKNQLDVATAAVSNFKRFFNADVAVFLSDLDGDFVRVPHSASTFIPSEKELSVPAWVHWNEKRAGKFTETLPFAEATYYPLIGPRYPLGVVGVKSAQGDPFSIDQEVLLQNFINQVSSALEREFLNDMTKQSISFLESERLYTTLFNSISHEMRTPITALLGASETLSSDAVTARPGLREQLASEIQSAAERLDSIVQNLLAMTRVESGLIHLKADWTDVQDLIRSSLKKLERELSGHGVSVEISPEVPLLKLDFALMEQAFVNLFRNIAVHTHSDSAVAIKAVARDSKCIITVSDNGPGFPLDSLETVFDKFYRVPGSKTGGVGLGLSIAKGFIQAHGGTIVLRNNEGSGATFTIELPIDPASRSRLEYPE